MAVKKAKGGKGSGMGGPGCVTVKPKKDTMAKNVGGSAHMGSTFKGDNEKPVKKSGGRSK